MEYEINQEEKNTLELNGDVNQLAFAAAVLCVDKNNKYGGITIKMEGINRGKLVLEGTHDQIAKALRALYEEDALDDCGHEYTETVSIDDDRWLGPDGLHERSNPDAERCKICGAYYNKLEEEWQHQD